MSDEGPVFAVVVPTRDRPELLARALASVAAQTEVDWVCVVVDDAGAAAATVPADPRFSVVRNPEPLGPAGARNRGVAAAPPGIRWIVFLDDDDVMVPDRLALVAGAPPEADVVVTGCRFEDEGPAAGRPRRLAGAVADVIADTFVPHLDGVAVAAAAWIDFDATLRSCEDVDWWIRIAPTVTVATVDATGAVLGRHRSTRFDSGVAARAADSVRLLERHAGYFAGHPTARAFRWRRVAAYRSELGDRRGALRALWAAARARPSAGLARQAIAVLRRPAGTIAP